MKERPILFSGPMVRALLNGTKTMTRRVVKGLKPEIAKAMDLNRGLPLVLDENGYGGLLAEGPGLVFGIPLPRCPYGVPGELLWVRESCWIFGRWVKNGFTERGRQRYRFREIGRQVRFDRPLEHELTYMGSEYDGYAFRPSIHMPRWASRLTLTLTDVRVERVQEISTHDLEAEGISIVNNDAGARNDYRDLWDSLNAGRGYGWDVNPWVWVLAFAVAICASTNHSRRVREPQ